MDTLIATIVTRLEDELATATSASRDAHASATHSENVATSRYDTLAIEAAYLAHGQSMRIAELQESIQLYKNYQRPHFTQQSSIQLGALVEVENCYGDIQRLFIGPTAGGLRIGRKPDEIQILTVSTPLGRALLNKTMVDEIELKLGHRIQRLTIRDIG